MGPASERRCTTDGRGTAEDCHAGGRLRASTADKGATLGILSTMRTPRFLSSAAVLVMGTAAHAAGPVDASTLDGKVLLGYQGWFTCPSDGSGRWTHWARGAP